MKEKLTRNLGFKLLSLPLAAIIWLIIINIDDPVSTKVIPNVPVEILNESYITASGQVYDIVEGNTVAVTIRAKRSIRDKIKAADLKVTADLTQITQFNRVEIVAECTKYSSDYVEVSAKPKMLTVTLENRGTKTLPVQITTTGVVDSGYYVDSVKASPNMIEISGAESTVEKIAEVRVSVDVSGRQENFKMKELTPKLYDEKGREIDSSRLRFGHNGINVKVGILPTKQVPIHVTTKDEPAEGYTVSGVEYGPEQIELAGKPDVLSQIRSIPIEVSVKAATDNMEIDVDINEYIPEGTKRVSDINTIAVRITIEKRETKVIPLTEDSLKVENLPEGYRYSIVPPYPEIVIYANDGGDLSLISEDTLGAMINLLDCEEGTHVVPIQFSLPQEYRVSGEPSVTITIEKLEEEQPPEEETPEPGENEETENPEEIEE